MCRVTLLPRRSNSRSCRTRSSLTCGRRHVADLVEKHGSGVGLLELARLGHLRAGEGALLVAEEFALHEVLGQGGAIDLHQRPVFAGRVEVYGARDQVLTDAALSSQEHGGAGGTDAFDGGEDLLHGLAAADDVVELVAAAQLLFELAVLVAQGADFERLVDDLHQVFQRKRLEQEVRGAGLHGFDGGFHAAVGGHHDHGHLGVLAADLRQELLSVHIRELQVGEDHVGAIHQLESLFRGGGFGDFKAGGYELKLEYATELLFVFDNQNSFLHSAAGGV